jgi:hypothetical protein
MRAPANWFTDVGIVEGKSSASPPGKEVCIRHPAQTALSGRERPDPMTFVTLKLRLASLPGGEDRP